MSKLGAHPGELWQSCNHLAVHRTGRDFCFPLVSESASSSLLKSHPITRPGNCWLYCSRYLVLYGGSKHKQQGVEIDYLKTRETTSNWTDQARITAFYNLYLQQDFNKSPSSLIHNFLHHWLQEPHVGVNEHGVWHFSSFILRGRGRVLLSFCSLQPLAGCLVTSDFHLISPGLLQSVSQWSSSIHISSVKPIFHAVSCTIF